MWNINQCGWYFSFKHRCVDQLNSVQSYATNDKCPDEFSWVGIKHFSTFTFDTYRHWTVEFDYVTQSKMCFLIIIFVTLFLSPSPGDARVAFHSDTVALQNKTCCMYCTLLLLKLGVQRQLLLLLCRVHW